MAVPRVEIKTQPWGVVQDASGNVQSGLTATITKLDATSATVYAAATGGSTTTPATNSSGEIAGWIEPGEYDVTVPGHSAVRVQASRAHQGTQEGTTGAPTVTTHEYFQPRDSAKGPFTTVFGGASFNGTWDTVRYQGYNMGNAGSRPNTSEPSFGWCIEQDYEVVADEHWMEMYTEYRHSDGVIAGRPIFVRINRGDGLMEGFDIRSSGVAFTDWGNDAQFASIGGKTGSYYAYGHASQSGPTQLDLTALNSQEVGLGLHSFRGDYTIYNPATDQWAFAAGGLVFMQVSETLGSAIGFGNADAGGGAAVTVQLKDGVKTFWPTLKLKKIASQDQNLLSLRNDSDVEQFGFDVGGIPRWTAAALQQTTVGAAGGASALPATPTTWLKVKNSAGTTLVVPAFAAS